MHTALHAPIDIYCERVGTAFWAEPLNAVSNASFIVAALWAGSLAARGRVRAPDVWVLIVLAALIGIGSFLFHTYANAWSSLADVIPIWSFVALFVISAIQRIGGRRLRPGTIAIIAGVAVLVIVFMAAGDGADTDNAVAAVEGYSLLNGSQQYAPALIALIVFSVLTWRRGNPMAPWIRAATGVFFVSLVFRTLDMHLCGVWPLGTHVMWHLLNGLMIGILLDGYIRLLRR